MPIAFSDLNHASQQTLIYEDGRGRANTHNSKLTTESLVSPQILPERQATQYVKCNLQNLSRCYKVHLPLQVTL